MMEILAPAGGMDTIQPAVRTGADAVYLGASKLRCRLWKDTIAGDAKRIC